MDVTEKFYDEHWTKEEHLPDLAGKQTHLRLIFKEEEIAGKRVIDCGSGHGVTSLAFSRLGAAVVVGIDQSAKDVEFATAKAAAFDIGNCSYVVKNLLDGDALSQGLPFATYDIVYSFGVLHHTSAPRTAFRNIAGLVADGGQLCVGLYLRTPLTPFFDLLGSLYRASPRLLQKGWCRLVELALLLYDLLRGRKPHFSASRREEVDDWFGVPKRSHHTPEEVAAWYEELGFTSRFVGYTGRFKFSTNFLMVGRRS